jgi:hypothetical protein
MRSAHRARGSDVGNRGRAADKTRGGRRADMRSRGPAGPMHAGEPGRNWRRGAGAETRRRMNAASAICRGADTAQTWRRDAAASAHASGLRARMNGVCGLRMRNDHAAAMMAPDCWADDRPPAPVAAWIIAGAVRAVLLPALTGLHRLQRRFMCDRGESPTAYGADARLGAGRDGETHQGRRQTGENTQSRVRHQGLSWKERSA